MPVVKATKLEEAGQTVQKVHMISFCNLYSAVYSVPV